MRLFCLLCFVGTAARARACRAELTALREHQAESAAEQEEELAAARQKASDLEQQLAASQQEAGERERQLAASQKESASEQEQELAAARQKVADLEQQAAEREQQVEALEEQVIFGFCCSVCRCLARAVCSVCLLWNGGAIDGA